ncbi:MAG: L-threonylcarbamoyladenylate synthase [Pseudomonadota bacterium]
MTSKIVPASNEAISSAVDILRGGGLVAMPTETVYGLACDAGNSKAVARLYAAKGRPSFNPLIAHVSDIGGAAQEGVFSATSSSLAMRHWPGPLTLVVPLAETHTVCDLARAGLDTIALRSPAHLVARQLLKAFGKPVVAPSANPSGRISPTRAEHVQDDMGGLVDLIIDGGKCEVGIESTILSCVTDTPTVLRAGSIDFEGYMRGEQSETGPSSPGQMSKHYAPKAKLRLNVENPSQDEAYLGFGDRKGMHSLSMSGDLIEAASNLFSMLRELDKSYDRIAVAPIPDRGIGLAINDRLARAAKRD